LFVRPFGAIKNRWKTGGKGFTGNPMALLKFSHKAIMVDVRNNVNGQMDKKEKKILA